MSDEEYTGSDDQTEAGGDGNSSADADFVFEIFRYSFNCQVTIEQSQKEEVLGYMGQAVYEAMGQAAEQYGYGIEDFSASVEVVN